MEPGEEIAIAIPVNVAIVLDDMVERYYDSAKPESITDRAEWRALVLLGGALAEYDGMPF